MLFIIDKTVGFCFRPNEFSLTILLPYNNFFIFVLSYRNFK